MRRYSQMEKENNKAKNTGAEPEVKSGGKNKGGGRPDLKEQKKQAPQKSSSKDDAACDLPEKEEAPKLPENVEIVGVRFKKNGKVYYFAPNEMKFSADDHVIVETARGLEYGVVIIPNKLVPQTDIVAPLREVVRAATEEDENHYEDNLKKEVEAFNVCLEKIEAHKLDMKLIDVEYTFDNSKLLFYFTSDGRVDFRDLVKDLASHFRTRIELRQIGIRDEAKLVGGLGICGRSFCCNSFLNDFVQVSIKMAKEQNLSLNSSKISGACGRLMCCLRYEYDTYAKELAKMPKVDSVVITPEGNGIVSEISPLAGIVKVKMDSDSQIKAFAYDVLKVKIRAKNTGNNDIPEELKELEKD